MPPAVRRSFLAIVVLAGALALPAVALAGTGDAGLSPIDPSSENAHGITAIWWFVLAWAGVIFLLVTVPLVVFIVRYRSRGRPRTSEGPQVHGSTRLELAWTAFPIAVIIILGAFTFWKLGEVNDPAGAAGNPSTVLVQGRQFYWQFVYPNGAISINELRLPVDQVTTLEITAPVNDVIHSFWAPALGPKRDAIPGRVNTLKLKPLDEGSYEIRCAELCGLQHAVMDGTVVVVPADSVHRLGRRARRCREDEVGLARPRQGDLPGLLRNVPRPVGRGPGRAAPRRGRHEHRRRRADRPRTAGTRCPRSGRAGAPPSCTH